MLSLDTLLRRVPAMLTITAVLLVGVVATLGVRSWLATRDSAAQLAATVAAQKKLLDQAAVREQQRDAALAATLAGIARAKSSVQTPTQAVAQIPTVLPPLPAPLTLELPKPTPDQPVPPAVASVPQVDLKPLYDYLEDSRACQAQLTAANGDLADERTKVAALTTERDAALEKARGGGFWSHVRHGAKWFFIGGAVGAIAISGLSRR